MAEEKGMSVSEYVRYLVAREEERKEERKG